ncbi:MAG: nitrogenase-stabilizing/protective protein NifW [gamma proteobacterium symbiont of Bathyaustriella thionipta]|nr:nitrogenase-stabilizing/protective protein NifW [gamma proteobacterium symbiont of Bathyaustriella thionipta]
MSDSDFELDMDELSSAEDFLEYFGITYDPAVVHVNRLHILQRFHDYLARQEALPKDESALRAVYAGWLEKAYQDFVESDAKTEKVFKVFRMMEPQTVMIPLSDISMNINTGR